MIKVYTTDQHWYSYAGSRTFEYGGNLKVFVRVPRGPEEGYRLFDYADFTVASFAPGGWMRWEWVEDEG